ncbi:MAG: hypothetical protein HUU55_06515 [Myxococcales bacterium]|nr:hypothetical protein [Myxococcales bacterium]
MMVHIKTQGTVQTLRGCEKIAARPGAVDFWPTWLRKTLRHIPDMTRVFRVQFGAKFAASKRAQLFSQALRRWFLQITTITMMLTVFGLLQCDYGVAVDETTLESVEPTEGLQDRDKPHNEAPPAEEFGNNEGALGEWAPISAPTPLVQVRDERGRPTDMKQPAIHRAGHGVPEPWRDDETE